MNNAIVNNGAFAAKRSGLRRERPRNCTQSKPVRAPARNFRLFAAGNSIDDLMLLFGRTRNAVEQRLLALGLAPPPAAVAYSESSPRRPPTASL